MKHKKPSSSGKKTAKVSTPVSKTDLKPKVAASEPTAKPSQAKSTTPVPATKTKTSSVSKGATSKEAPSASKPVTAAVKAVPASLAPKTPTPEAVVKPSKSAKPVTAVPEKKTGPSPAKEKKKLQVPPILLEGDQPSSTKTGGPGKRYALGPTAPVERFEDEGELPDSYGTEQLFLTARDPHWLFAAWDLTQEQLRQYNTLSADHHLVLRIFVRHFSSKPVSEVHVHPESRNWFIPVAEAGTRYAVELGYYDASKKWITISQSGITLTPPDTLAEETVVRLTSLPADVPFEELITLVKSAVKEHVPLVEALQQLRAEGYKNLPGPAEVASPTPWTPAQEQALAQVVSIDQVRRVWIGSLEVTELIRRQLEKQVSSLTAAKIGGPSSPTSGFSSLSSPFGGAGAQKEKGFWFNVNAELIIYGATEPDASVTIGGRPIRLRPDGSFSFRFALPDGKFSLPAVAVNADGDDARAALLEFSRATEYRGDVGAHPQDESLQPPTPDAVS